jgi:hypothetical protein
MLYHVTNFMEKGMVNLKVKLNFELCQPGEVNAFTAND